MSGLNDIAKESRLNPVICKKCHNRIKTTNVIKAFFDIILEKIRNGEKVRINGFGVFYPKKTKPRKLYSAMNNRSLSDDTLIGEVVVKEKINLKFHQSIAAKNKLNEDRS